MNPVSGSPPSLHTVDDLIRLRAQDSNQQPLLALSASEHGLTDFEYFTGHDLDRLTDVATKLWMSRGLGPAVQSPAPVAALLGPSTIDYIITMLGLSRLGYAVLILSPRLPVGACISLLRAAEATTIVYHPRFAQMVHDIKTDADIMSTPLLLLSEYDIPATSSSKRFELEIDKEVASNRVAFIMHSSGSTGLPKLIHQTHRSCLETFAFGWGARSFTAAPIFHTYGHSTLFRSLYTRGTLFMHNANVPVTSQSLITVMEKIEPEVFLAVPYLLKLISESPRGLKALRACNVVNTSGSACPDELGNLLTENGVHYVTALGLTETGLLMTSKRPREDPTWDYMRILPEVLPYILMKPISEGICELIVLDGLKSKNASNSDDPPNSFHTRDIFSSHPVIPNAWKFIGRLDDRITLANGEKVLPIPMEGRIRQDARVREAVVFGIGRDIPGLLVFRSDCARVLSDHDFVSAIWPAVLDANSHAESFSQISRDMIVPMSADISYPQNDKGTIIRTRVYALFADPIDQSYKRLQDSSNGQLRLGEEELRAYLIETCRQRLHIQLNGADTELFSAGLDSLKAIQLVGEIKKDLYLGNAAERLDQNTIYEKQNVNHLARYLCDIQSGRLDRHEDEEEKDTEVGLVDSLIEKYSSFSKRTVQVGPASPDWIVLLTGATGSLGSHILAELISHTNVRQIICLIRASPPLSPSQRILSALSARGLMIPDDIFHDRVMGVVGNFKDPTLGLPPDVIDDLRKSRCLIIHTAWEVNFNLPLASFEAESIAGTKHLLDLSISVQTAEPARFVLCSSISTAMNSPPGTTVLETAIEEVHHAQATGYARSKFVAEHIAHNAAITAGADVRVMRIGQIVGDSRNGLWNDSEAIPLMIRSASVIGVLPELHDKCSWLPVDQCAVTVLELSGLTKPASKALRFLETSEGPPRYSSSLYYNVLHPRVFDWNDDLLPALRNAGLYFTTAPPQEWVRLLERSAADPKINPSVKLLGFWKGRYDRETANREEDGNPSRSMYPVAFSTAEAERDSITLRQAQHCVSTCLVDKFVQRWKSSWTD